MAFFQGSDHTDQLDPRIAFWSKPDKWPDKSPTHIFLAPAILEVGRLLYGETWTGKEPEVELLAPLPDQLHASIGKPELLYGCRLLHETCATYRTRCPDFVEYVNNWPIPSADEWAIAVEAALQRAEESRLEFNRFADVCLRLHQAFKSGAIETATRGHDGGIETPAHRSLWYTENVLGRFYTCQVNLADPYKPTIATHGAYLFVERLSFLEAVAPRQQTPTSEQSPPSNFEPLKYLSPYLRCMIDATIALGLNEADTRKKEEIMHAIPQHWPGRRDELTDEDIRRMATFMREPEHKKGRAKKVG